MIVESRFPTERREAGDAPLTCLDEVEKRRVEQERGTITSTTEDAPEGKKNTNCPHLRTTLLRTTFL
jgi:hypothetical protein